MFIRASTIALFVAALAGFASAVPTDLEARGGSSTCNSGSVHCCENLQRSDSTIINTVFPLFGFPPPPANTQVGFTCSPVNIGGTGTGANCNQQTVCCENNQFNGAIVIGCTPVILNQ